MKSVKLDIQVRDTDAPTSRLESMVPGILYGPGIENVKLAVDHQALRKAFNLNNENLQIEFELNGKSHSALIRDVRVDYIADRILHFDLFIPSETSIMKFNLPIKFVGQSLAVKNLGGVLETYKEKVVVHCTLKDLPEYFEVDISPLVELGSIIKIKDLQAPENVEFIESPTQSLVASKAPKRGGKKSDDSSSMQETGTEDAPSAE
jgi:large subunit ribosomal protein L25